MSTTPGKCTTMGKISVYFENAADLQGEVLERSPAKCNREPLLVSWAKAKCRSTLFAAKTTPYCLYQNRKSASTDSRRRRLLCVGRSSRQQQQHPASRRSSRGHIYIQKCILHVLS